MRVWLTKWYFRGTEFIAAAILAALFGTFLLQIFSRYVMVQPFGWTLELCLTLWIWLVFFSCAFILKDDDHVKFDVIYLSRPARVRRWLSLISAAAIAAGILWALLPTLDYLDWMKIRKSATLKIPLRTVFSIYGVFMAMLIMRYTWRFFQTFKRA